MAGATIAVAPDHAGLDLKETLERHLKAAGHNMRDRGSTGIGVSVAADHHPEVRAARDAGRAAELSGEPTT